MFYSVLIDLSLMPSMFDIRLRLVAVPTIIGERLNTLKRLMPFAYMRGAF